MIYTAYMKQYFELFPFPDDLLGVVSSAASSGADEDGDAEDTLP